MQFIRRRNKQEQAQEYDESFYVATQWQLIWRKYRRHKLAMLGTYIVISFYLLAIFAEFVSPYDYQQRFIKFAQAPPQAIHFVDEDGKFHFQPFVYAREQELDMDTFERHYHEDKSVRYPIKLFTRGYSYEFYGLFETDIHLFGVDEPALIFLFGTDEFGRDLFARNFQASRISLSLGFFGVMISFVLGCLIGGISGYYGGTIDLVIQRIIEFIISIPQIPLWIALAAAFPPEWTSIQVYFGITVVLATVGWTGLARVVRGKLLELREADFVMAARISNTSDFQIIVRHLLPSFASFLIVALSLSVPGMILAETGLSFLGIGIRPPSVSWGVLLQDAQNIRSLSKTPWLLIPGLFVFIVVLGFNFVGDGLRDAADPYKQ